MLCSNWLAKSFKNLGMGQVIDWQDIAQIHAIKRHKSEPVSSAILYSGLTTILPKVTLQASSPCPYPKFLLARSITLGLISLRVLPSFKNVVLLHNSIRFTQYCSCIFPVAWSELKTTVYKISSDSDSCYLTTCILVSGNVTFTCCCMWCDGGVMISTSTLPREPKLVKTWSHLSVT